MRNFKVFILFIGVGLLSIFTAAGREYHVSVKGSNVENPGALTPIRHANLALNNAGVRGSILVDFPFGQRGWKSLRLLF